MFDYLQPLDLALKKLPFTCRIDVILGIAPSTTALLEWESNTLYPVMVSLLQHKQGGDKAIIS